VDKKRSGTDGQRLVEEFERSGLTRRRFCERNSISLTALDYWRWKKRQVSKPRMVEIAVEAVQPPAAFAVVLRNGRRIESAWGFDELQLSRLIRIVESV
jgi:hypothetical protein